MADSPQLAMPTTEGGDILAVMAARKPAAPPAPVEPDDEEIPRVRLIIDTSEELRQALSLRVLRRKVEYRRTVGQSEAVNEILTAALADELKQVAQMAKPKSK